MMFMNEWEIEENRDRYATHPILGPATRFLYDFMLETNRHSDGWPYWSAPVKAAKQLMLFVQKEDGTQAELLSAIRPIKSFMTRRGNAAGMTLPSFRGDIR